MQNYTEQNQSIEMTEELRNAIEIIDKLVKNQNVSLTLSYHLKNNSVVEQMETCIKGELKDGESWFGLKWNVKDPNVGKKMILGWYEQYQYFKQLFISKVKKRYQEWKDEITNDIESEFKKTKQKIEQNFIVTVKTCLEKKNKNRLKCFISDIIKMSEG